MKTPEQKPRANDPKDVSQDVRHCTASPACPKNADEVAGGADSSPHETESPSRAPKSHESSSSRDDDDSHMNRLSSDSPTKFLATEGYRLWRRH